MIPGGSPLAAWALAAVWGGAVGAGAGAGPVQSQDGDTGVWLAEIGVAVDATGSGPAPVVAFGIAIAPVASAERPEDGEASLPVYRVSDRGWIGEPTDTVAANQPYPPRLAEPPAIERALPIYPDAERRLAYTAGELRLLNGDGQLDQLAGDWSTGGRKVVLRRGPHRRPLHAPLSDFVQIAELRASAPAAGTSRLALTLRPPSADLDLPLCATYAGTGGAEGPAALKGRNKPRLYGYKRNVEPALVDPGLLLYQLHDGPIEQVVAVRDRGVALTNAGDLASYAALAAASVSSGTFKTCLAAGVLRVGLVPSSLTVDARGDNAAGTGGYNTGSASGIAQKLLQGPGGIAAASGLNFSWPVGEYGAFYTGGKVGEALDQLASSIFGWWGADASGVYRGGQLYPPEMLQSTLTIEPHMMASPPEEVGPPRAPWWRVRVGYQVLGRVQADETLAGAVTATDRAYYSQAWRSAVAIDTGVSAAYPLAEDGPELLSGFELQADAQSLADTILALFGRPRRAFQVVLRGGAGGWCWPTIELGACVTLRWPQNRALAAGRPMIVQAVSARGDAVTLTLWG